MSQTYYFQIKGMTCGGCEATLYRMVSELPCVEKCQVSHRLNLLEVAFNDKDKSKTDIYLQKVKQTSDDIGFEASYMEADQDAFKSPVDNKPKTSRYLANAVINITVGILWHFICPIVAGLGLSMLAGMTINLAVLGLMTLTGQEFYHDAWLKIKSKRTSMNTLIALSTLTAIALSFLGTMFPITFVGSAFKFMPIFMILGITNLGRSVRAFQEAKAFQLMQTFDDMFQKNQPKLAKAVKDLETKAYVELPYNLIKINDYVLVKEGERLPIDGQLVSDRALLNQKILTGDSLLSKKQKGDNLHAGTLNTQGTIVLKATRPGSENSLVKLLETVRKSQLHHATSPKIDKVIQWFVPSVIGFACLAGIGWGLASASPVLAFNAVISVLLCACPCALGLAAPLSQALAIYKMLHQNILVRHADKLSSLDDVDTLVFDKTGTLSDPCVQGCFVARGQDMQDSLRIIASLESSFSSHPIAKACMSYYGGNQALYPTEHVKNHHSQLGVQGDVNGVSTWLGQESMMRQEGIKISQQMQRKLDTIKLKGHDSLCLAQEGSVKAVLTLCDTLKPRVAETLKILKNKYSLVLLTGSSKKATDTMMKGLAFDKIYANKTSEQKRNILHKFKKDGKKVAYIGDHLNDVQAAQESAVSIAIAPWTHLASIADISLKGNIADLIKCMRINQLLQNNIQQNLVWTFAYNSVSLLVASGALFPFIGVTFNPMIFAGTMAISSLGVIANASRLPSQVDRLYRSSSSSEMIQSTEDITLVPQVHESSQPQVKNKSPSIDIDRQTSNSSLSFPHPKLRHS